MVTRPFRWHTRRFGRTVLTWLRLAKEHASTATLDQDFARDLEEGINSLREPLNPPLWD